jgi:hypothetical protein
MRDGVVARDVNGVELSATPLTHLMQDTSINDLEAHGVVYS